MGILTSKIPSLADSCANCDFFGSFNDSYEKGTHGQGITDEHEGILFQEVTLKKKFNEEAPSVSREVSGEFLLDDKNETGPNNRLKLIENEYVLFDPPESQKYSCMSAREVFTKHEAEVKSSQELLYANNEGTPRSPVLLLLKKAPVPKRSWRNQNKGDSNDTLHLTGNFHWENTTKEIQGNPKGAYLIFQANNDGAWFIQWSVKYIGDAWLFARPQQDSNIPQYKFLNATREEITRGVYSSSRNYCVGFLFFLKTLRKYKSSLYILEPFETQHTLFPELFEMVMLGLYHSESLQIHLSTNQPQKKIENLAVYGAAVVVQGAAGSQKLYQMASEGKDILLSEFLALGDCYGASISFLNTEGN